MPNTTAILNYSTLWSETDTNDNNSNNTVIDSGKIVHQVSYPSGVGTAGIDTIFHDSTSVPSGSSFTYDLSNLTGTILGESVVKSFAQIKSLTISNTSTNISGDMSISSTGADLWSVAFGEPLADINITPNSLIHYSVTGTPGAYSVLSNRKNIILIDVNSTAPSYEVVILGNE